MDADTVKCLWKQDQCTNYPFKLWLWISDSFMKHKIKYPVPFPKNYTKKTYEKLVVNFVNSIIEHAQTVNSPYFYIYRGEKRESKYYSYIKHDDIIPIWKPSAYTISLPYSLDFSFPDGEKIQILHILRLKKGDLVLSIVQEYFFGDKKEFSINEQEIVIPHNTIIQIFQVERYIRYGFPFIVVYEEIVYQDRTQMKNVKEFCNFGIPKINAKTIMTRSENIPHDLKQITTKIKKRIKYESNLYEKLVLSPASLIPEILFQVIFKYDNYYVKSEKEKENAIKSLAINEVNIVKKELENIKRKEPENYNLTYYFFTAYQEKKINPEFIQPCWLEPKNYNELEIKLHGKLIDKTYKIIFKIKKANLVCYAFPYKISHLCVFIIPPYNVKILKKTSREMTVEIY